MGLYLTEVIAKIFMNWWDKKFLENLNELRYTVYIYKRYVDDINICMEQVKNEENRLSLGANEEPELSVSNMENDEGTFKIISNVADSITECIKVETDYPSKNDDCKIPVLYLKLWIQEVNGKFIILYENYMKPMASRYVILFNSAMLLQAKRTILTQECLNIVIRTEMVWQSRVLC